MAVNIAVGDVIQVRLNYSIQDALVNAAFNVLHYQVAQFTGSLPGINVVLSEVAEAAVDLWGDAWSGGASNEVFMVGASAQDVHPAPRSKLVTYTPADLIQGEVVSQSLPLQDAPTIVKDSDFGQKWGLGRLFYVGVPESMANLGVVIPGVTRDAMVTMKNRIPNTLDAVGTGWSMSLNPILYHAATPAKPGKPATETRITRITGSHIQDFIIKSQRSRRVGKGI